MKQSGYRAILHIYLIFFLTLAGTILGAAVFTGEVLDDGEDYV